MSNLVLVHTMSEQAPKKKRGPKPLRQTKFGTWINSSEWKGCNAQLAEELGMSVQYLERLINGRELPGLALALKIKDFTKGALDLDALCDEREYLVKAA